MPNAASREDIAKLAEIIKDIRIAMLTTQDEGGELRSRPMAVQEVEFDGDLWFFTREHSATTGEVARDHQVNVALSDADHQRYVSLSGTASVVLDHAKMAELWRPTLKAWFPKGLEDPELALLKVSVDQAEYWDTPPSPVVRIFVAAKASVTGRPYDPGDHGKVDLR